MGKKDIRTIGNFFYSMQQGGTEKVISLLIPIWKELGCKVVLFTDEERCSNEYYVDYTYVTRVVLKNTSVTARKDYTNRENELKSAIKENNIDIMIYHAWTSPIILREMSLMQAMGIPFVVYTHSVFSSIYYYRDEMTPILPDILKKSNGVLSLTEVSNQFYKSIGCKSFSILNPISPELYNVKPVDGEENAILWVGRISTEKNPRDAIRIFSRVIKKIPQAQLYIVGDGNEYILNQMKQDVKKEAIEHVVHFEGFKDNVSEYYDKATIMLMTSFFEGYSLTLLESKAHGLPCVMYELPYLPLAEGAQGICAVEQNDIDAAAEQVIAILQNKRLAEELSKQARNHFEELCRFDLKAGWKDILHDIADDAIENPKDESITSTMLELFVEHNEIGVRNAIEAVRNSKEYIWGERILYYPRRLKWLLKRLFK